MNIGICDDLPVQCELIHRAALDYFSRHEMGKPEFSIYHNPLLFLESLKRTGGFDILLLDICMSGLNGISVAQEIRDRKERCEIIFLTTSDEFAVEAFALKAAHYLLKPFSQEQFDEAMDRALVRFQGGIPKKITLRPLGGGVEHIAVDDILYIESYGHTLNVYLKTGHTTESRRSLAHLLGLLSELSPNQFDTPFKGFLVNHKCIRTIESSRIILQNGAEIPIARGTFREFQKRHFAYMFPEGSLL